MGLARLLVPLLVVLVGIVVVVSVLGRGGDRRVELQAGDHSRWVPGHRTADGSTLVLVRRLALEDGRLLEERVVDTILETAPDYDERFLAAMAAARNRAALYASEEE